MQRQAVIRVRKTNGAREEAGHRRELPKPEVGGHDEGRRGEEVLRPQRQVPREDDQPGPQGRARLGPGSPVVHLARGRSSKAGTGDCILLRFQIEAWLLPFKQLKTRKVKVRYSLISVA